MQNTLFITSSKHRLVFLILFFCITAYFNVNSAFASCLTFSTDGTTVTGTDGTCTVVTAADFGNATKIADKSSGSAGVFYSSKDTLTSVTFPAGLTKIGDFAFYDCTNLTGNLTIPNSVTYIGYSAFSYCSGLTGGLTIPNSVTYIGNLAFYNCSGLTGSLTIGNSVATIGGAAFYNCRGFTGNLTIPNSVTSIGSQAFYNCRGFTGSLTIPNFVTSIGYSAFSYCSGLTGSLTVPNSVTSIGDSAFYNCSGFTGSLTIPSSITTIGSSVFSGCRGLTGSLTIPDSVTSIGGSAFYNCSGLDGILFTNKTATVGSNAFINTAPVYCYADSSWINDGGGTKVPFITTLFAENVQVDEGESILASFTTNQAASNAHIPSVTWSASTPAALTMPSPTEKGILSNTITGNTKGLYTVTLNAAQVGSDLFGSDAVPAIPSTTFYVTVKNGSCLIFSEDETTVIGTDGTCMIVTAEDFGNATDIANETSGVGPFESSKNTLASVEIPYGFTRIATGAFRNCGKLESVTIPETVVRIHANAFNRCTALTNLSIPASVQIIGNHAFQYCSSLGNLIIPETVESIGMYTFRGCNANILFSNKTASVGTNAFQNDTVFCYKDSEWLSASSGFKRYFITTVSVNDMTVEQNITTTVPLITEPSESSQYIPSLSWSLSKSYLGAFIFESNILSFKGTHFGKTSATLDVDQLGSDIFGNENVPDILPTSFNITVYKTSLVRSDSSAIYNNGTAPGRLFLNSTANTDKYTTFKVYVKPGETVYLGTSSFGNNTDILVKHPDGTYESVNVVYDGEITSVYSSGFRYQYARDASKAGPGLILNFEQEQAGPSVLSSNGSGYNPYVINITQEGFLDVLFYPHNRTAASSMVEYNDEFIHNQKDSFQHGVAAWDITVVDENGQKVNGRVFTDHFNFVNNSAQKVKFTGYILTYDGNIYYVDTGLINGIDWLFFANSRGIIHDPTNTIFYGSIYGCFLNNDCIRATNSDSDSFSAHITTNLNFTPNANGDVMFRLFLNYPDEDLLEYLGLTEPLANIAISDFTFTEDVNNGGGAFSFVSNHNLGSYSLYIEQKDDTTGERTVLIGNTIRENMNTIYWDGKDNQGNNVDVANCKFKLRITSGETHILFDDIEYIYDGLKITSLTSDANNTYIYYNNSNITIDGTNNRMNQFITTTPTEMEMYGGNLVNSSSKDIIYLYGEPNQTNGIDTYLHSSMKTENKYSDMTTINMWMYGHSDVEEYEFDKVKIVKDWQDEDNRDNLRPESVFVNLYTNGESDPDNPYEISSSNDWSVTLKFFKKLNEARTYSIEELRSD